MSRLLEKSLFLLSLLLVINVTVINLLVLHRSKDTEAQAITQTSEAVCDALCQKNVAAMIKDQISPLPNKQPVQTQQQQIVTNSEPREYLLTLGTGSVDTLDWSDVPGVEIMIDTSKYPPIKQAYFETYMSIPIAGGFAHAKLVNVTDKHDVWFSEVSMEADKIVRQEVPITLTSGEKRYKVMMKSTLERDALLHNARIKLITE
jgi:hypothetical protein